MSKHECDCGAVYSNLDALLACQNANHGARRKPESNAHYVAALERLWDMLSDAVEGGRLTPALLPDDYAALVSQMTACESARNACDPKSNQREQPYTVVGLYPDSATGFPHPRDGSFVTSVNAESAGEAAAKAAEEMATGAKLEADDIAVLAVFEGQYDDVMEGV